MRRRKKTAVTSTKKLPVERWILPCLTGIVAAVTLLTAVILRARIPDCGMAKADHIDEIPKEGVLVNYPFGLGVDEEQIERMASEEYWKTEGKYDTTDAPIVARVRPTGNLDLSVGSLGQEFQVEEVLRGEDCLAEGQTSYMYQALGFVVAGGIIEYQNVLNLMDPDYEYLIFLEESPLNERMETPVYLQASDYFGYIKLGGEPTGTLAEGDGSYEFKELREYEFFSVAPEITDRLNQARKEILTEYGMDGTG